MGLGSNHTGVVVADKWIPQQWQDEAIATYMARTVMRNLVTTMTHQKHKGDSIIFPKPARGDATAKAVNTAVTLIADTATDITLTINKHYEYSKLYEDIADMMALNGMKKFYTKDAGYALARRVDAELFKIMATMNGGSIAGATNSFEKGVIGGDGSTNFSGTTPGNGTALTDAGLRTAIQTLEDNDIDSSELNFVVPPTVIKTLRGIARFTEQAFRGDGDALRTGRVGNLYGVEVYASSLCPWIHVNSVTSTQSVTFSSTAPTGTAYADEFGHAVNWSASTPTDAKFRACALIHPDAMMLAEMQAIRVQQQYKQEYLGYLVTADTIFGCVEMRDYAALSVIVPA